MGKSPPTPVASLPSGSAREEGLLPDEAGDALPWMGKKMSTENIKQREKNPEWEDVGNLLHPRQVPSITVAPSGDARA